MNTYYPKAVQVSQLLWEVKLPNGASIFNNDPLVAKIDAMNAWREMQQTQAGKIPGGVGFMGYKQTA